MQTMKKTSIVGVFLGSLMMAQAASAAYTYNWTFSGGGGLTCPTTGCVESSTKGSKTISTTATGWYSEMGANATIQQAYKLRMWDGLAVEATKDDHGVPQHATDNSTWYDSVLFDFGGDKVALNQIKMGWTKDADFSLLRYTKNDTPDLTNQSYSALNTTGGWELVDNYLYSYNSNKNPGTDVLFDVNPDNKSSSYWLVAALNPAYFSNSNYIGNDYFKIKTLSGEFDDSCTTNCGPVQVSAPGSLVLLLLGLPLLRVARNQFKMEKLAA